VPLVGAGDKGIGFHSVNNKRKPMVVKQKRSAEYWKEVIEDFLKSGMLQKEYVKKHNISRATFSAWSRRLGIPLSGQRRNFKSEKEPLPISFIDIEPMGRAKMPSSLKIEISFPQGHTLKLAAEGTWEEVGTLIKAMMG
jgi:hypothetical protein